MSEYLEVLREKLTSVRISFGIWMGRVSRYWTDKWLHYFGNYKRVIVVDAQLERYVSADVKDTVENMVGFVYRAFNEMKKEKKKMRLKNTAVFIIDFRNKKQALYTAEELCSRDERTRRVLKAEMKRAKELAEKFGMHDEYKALEDAAEHIGK